MVLAFQSYKIFPEVSYISVNKNNVVLIQYKRTAIAVTTGNINGKDLKVPVKIDRVFENYTGKSTIKISKKYAIKLIRNRDKLEALVCFTEETNKKQNMELLKSENHEMTQFKDIIKLENDETYVPSGTIINKYIIMGNEVLKFSQGLEEIID